ncbi:ATP-binding protein [Nafulsella turpanensis]|uniref:ATP-binding protein n=1 Tax=Nafulsella turpanensis TaxID=1265690 RepID=UPI0009DA021A|nr:ATP-binding protein [Nafulsella turpanensis]
MGRKKDKTDVLGQMLLVEGPVEHRFPRNVALMMFNERPDKFFPATWVDVVYFPKGEGNPEFTEFPKITGPVPAMIRKTLDLLQTNFLKEKVIKQEGKAEAVRVWNYPYAALEEVVANALYHRDYLVREQVELRITPESIVILNYGGPDRSIRQEDVDSGRIRPRRYRNRRLGDFLKELDLTEGRATGIPTIKRVLEINGSPPPVFRTDDERTFFEVEIFCHPAFVVSGLDTSDQAGDQAGDQADQMMGLADRLLDGHLKVLMYVSKPAGRKEILEEGLGFSSHTKNVKRYIDPLLEMGLMDRTIKDRPRSPLQQYVITQKGRDLLGYLKKK